jgi:hypothetical protein
MQQTDRRAVYPIGVFCKTFGVGLTVAYQEIRANRLKAFKVGRKTMVAAEDAFAWRDTYRAAGFTKSSYPKRAA